jgi:DNA-binding NarL/FixJ family response regulator
VACRVLVVDDHPSFRRVVGRLLVAGGYEVVGSVDDGARAIDEAVRLRPDIVLLDVLLPDIDGFEVARRLSVIESPPVVVLVSSRGRSELIDRIERAPVRGFLSKSELTLQALEGLLG